MSSGMPELGSKISLISKADIRYEGRLFTVDPQECTIALANVRSFGTEDREAQFPVAPQSQVYDYILFRGSDIKDIRIMNNVPSLPNDPAIMQMSVPPSLGAGGAAGQFTNQFAHPVVGQSQYPPYHPMAGFPASMHPQLNKTSELSPQTSVDLAPQPQPTTAPIGSGVVHHTNQVKDQGSMLDLIGGGSQQNASRSGTPAIGGHRKSPTADQSTQVGEMAGGSGAAQRRGGSRPSSRSRQRRVSAAPAAHHQPRQPGPGPGPGQGQAQGQGFVRGGAWRGRLRGRGRGFVNPRNKNTLKFDNDYDFEQANTEFEELRTQLSKTKITDGETKAEGEVDKKDDSGNETGAGEPELEDDPSAFNGYDKTKSFFDNISCEAVERSKGRSQRTDWRTERKLNSETFGVASARRGAWRGRGTWRYPQQHQPWRQMRGGRGRSGQFNQNNSNNQNNRGQQRNSAPSSTSTAPVQSQPQSASAVAN